MDLKKLVLAKIETLGVKEAAKYFGVSAGTVSNWSTGKTSPSIDAAQAVLLDGGVEIGTAEPQIVEEKLVEWEGRKVILLMPVYRTYNPDTHFTLFANYAKYGPEKIGMIQEKKTNVYEARNIMVKKFLNETDAPFGLMGDDDMIYPTGNPGHMNVRYKAGLSTQLASRVAISRIMSWPEDKKIVGALYFGRHDGGKAQCSKGFAEPASNNKFRAGLYGDGLVPVDWVGTGFMRIHRSVFEEMQKEIDAGRWGDDLKPLNIERGWYGFFTPNKVGIGEDVSFCLRAKAIGIQTYVDAGLVCLHAGDRLYGPNNTKS
jgi:transcriptional regulator with XRE-family HTH domain